MIISLSPYNLEHIILYGDNIMIIVKCTKCSAKVKTLNKDIGKVFKCRMCGNLMRLVPKKSEKQKKEESEKKVKKENFIKKIIRKIRRK